MLHATLPDLVDDHAVAQPTASHVDHVRDGNRRLGRRELLLLQQLLIVDLLLSDQRRFFVSRIAQQSAGHRSNHASDSGSGSRFSVFIADQPAGDGARQTTQSGSALLVHLGVSGAGEEAYQDDRTKLQNRVSLAALSDQDAAPSNPSFEPPYLPVQIGREGQLQQTPGSEIREFKAIPVPDSRSGGFLIQSIIG